MSIFLIRYIISLAFGSLMTFVFADIRIRKNYWQIFAAFSFLLVVEVLIYLLGGIDCLLETYPFHTHLLLVLFLIIFYKIRWFNALMYMMLAYMSCQIPAWLSKLIASFFLRNAIVELVVYLILVIITAGIIVRTVKDSARELLSENLFSDLAFGLIPITYYIFDYVTTIWTEILYTGNYYVTQFMPFVLCLGYIIFLIVYQRQQKIRKQTYEEKVLLESNMALIESEMESIKELERMARIYRHDMRHHLQLILDLIHSERYDQAESYILENVEAIVDITPKRYTDIETLNLLLGRYEKIAEEENISCHFDVNVPEKLPLSNMEICAMVSNVLENACQANMNLSIENRSIELMFKCHNDMLLFSEENTCDEGIVMDKIHSYPDWNKEHGFGTKSIEAIVKKYNGSITVLASGGRYHIIVLIPNP